MTRGQRIIAEGLAQHDVTREQLLLGPCRKKDLIKARRDIASQLRTELSLSYGSIGRLLNRHHGSIKQLIIPEYAARKHAWYLARRQA